jgi:hypothetical protein
MRRAVCARLELTFRRGIANMKAEKMTKVEKIGLWVLIILSVPTLVLIFPALCLWNDLQLDKLDYEDERLAMIRAYYLEIPGRNAWKAFRRGQPGYKRYA